jgi:hypothetical protein
MPGLVRPLIVGEARVPDTASAMSAPIEELDLLEESRGHSGNSVN